MEVINIYQNIRDFIYDLIFPKKCSGCRKEGFWICRDCRKKIVQIQNPFCPQCHKLTPNGQYCSRHRKYHKLTGIIIAAHYKEGPIREMIHDFKYNKIKALADSLSEILIERFSLGFPSGDLVVIPIPLHRSRKAERGFNQAEILAQKIASVFEIDYYPKVLRKIRKTKPQMKLSGQKRVENIKNAFKYVGSKKLVEDKTVLLIDDVTTTGSTLDECAKELRKMGARQVWGVVLAKG